MITHKSILNLLTSGILNSNIHYCNVDEFGFIDLVHLESILKKCNRNPILVSVQFANNEVGSINDIKRISNLVHIYNGILHVDATQVFGKIHIDVKEKGIDIMSASAHKLSPVLRGIGFLYIKNGIKINPLIYGSQENGLRGGTENTYGIIGLNKAIEYCYDNYENNAEIASKRDYFINILKSKFGCKLNGDSIYRLPNNINVTFPQNITGESLLHVLDIGGIKASSGSACNSNLIKPSYVLKEIGLTDDEAMKTIRFTIPEDITYKDIDYVIDEIDKAIKIITL